MPRILLFGELREIAGSSAIDMEVNNVESLKSALFTQWPSFAHKTLSIAINKKIVHDNATICSTDEVAVMPPFSGG